MTDWGAVDLSHQRERRGCCFFGKQMDCEFRDDLPFAFRKCRQMNATNFVRILPRGYSYLHVL